MKPTRLWPFAQALGGLLVGLLIGVVIGSTTCRPPTLKEQTEEAMREMFGSSSETAAEKPLPARSNKSWTAAELSVPGKYMVTKVSFMPDPKSGGSYAVVYDVDGGGWGIGQTWVSVAAVEMTAEHVKRRILRKLERKAIEDHNADLLRE